MSNKDVEAHRNDVWAWAVPCVVYAAALAVCASGMLAPLSIALADVAFATLKRPASGQVIIVQIDARSVGEIGAWPWPRKAYAKAIDILHDAGASTIGLDADLPQITGLLPSDALARAATRAKGSVVFRSDASGAHYTSFASRIADALPASSQASEVDYSIDPASFPRLSFLDV